MQALFLSTGKLHYAWYDTHEMSAGTITDHAIKRGLHRFTIKPFKGRPVKVQGLAGISSNSEFHFAWLVERVPKGDPDFFLWACQSVYPWDLGSKRDWFPSRLPPGAGPDNLRFITSNDKYHYAWFQKGAELWMGKGPIENLGKNGLYRFLLPPDVMVEAILYMSTDNKQHYAFLKNGTYLTGSKDRLDLPRGGSIYDLATLKDLLKV